MVFLRCLVGLFTNCMSLNDAERLGGMRFEICNCVAVAAGRRGFEHGNVFVCVGVGMMVQAPDIFHAGVSRRR